MVRALACLSAVVLALAIAPRVADAKMMEHFDLAGLVMRSDTILIAERVGPGADASTTRYHPAQALRGALPAADLELADSLYDIPKSADVRVVVFLSTRDGRTWIVPSGLRVIDHGKVFRYEQWDNPGGWTKVPQGQDPQDQWQAPTPQLDFAGLQRALADAIRRVDAVSAAGKLTDPAKRRAALLSLLPAPGVATSSSGFYVDLLAQEVQRILASAGDLEGALLAETHDHTSPWLQRDGGSLNELVAYARDAGHPLELRVIAIGAAARQSGYLDDAAAVRAMIALVADPSPAIRAAAVAAAARPANASTSDAKAQKQLTKLATEAREAIGTQYATETNGDVLFAISDAYEGTFRRALPARRGAPAIAAHARLDHAYINVDVVCANRKARAKNAKLVALQNGAPVTVHAYNVSPRCGDGSDGVGTASVEPLPPGRYDLSVELDVDRLHVAQPLGTLVIDPSGEARWVL